MAVYGYTKNYKLIKPQFDTDTWHDYEYDNLDTIDAVLSAIFASGDWHGFWKTNTHYDAGGVVIDRDTDTMYKIMVEHTTSEATFALEQAAHPTYYELWSPNNLAEDWAIKMDGVVSNVDYSSKAYAISSALIDAGSAKEWAIETGGSIGTTGEYSAKKYATDAHNDYISMTTDANVVAVGSNIADVNAVGQSISNVNTVASDISSVNAVAGVSTDVTTVASIATAVSNVSAIESSVLDVSDNRTDISTVASNINDVNTVAGVSTAVSTVATNDANVTTVATNISDVNTAATNIAAIQAAPTAATNAAASATLAQDWATKMDGQVASTDYSSKYYAGQAAGSATASASSATLASEWATKMDATVDGNEYSAKWWALQANAERRIGQLVYSTIPLSDAGLHLADGSLISGSGSYAAFVTYMAGLVSTNPEIFETEANWQSSVSTYGVCGKYVYDNVNNTIRLPKLEGFVEGTNTTTAVGDIAPQAVKLPDLTGRTGHQSNAVSGAVTGVFYNDGVAVDSIVGTTHQAVSAVAMKASRVSSVYSGNGTDTTIHPQSIKVLYYVVIATATRTDIQVDIDEIAADLNGKADTDASNFNATGKSLLSGLGKPNTDRTVAVTPLASASTYTAPANGYFSVLGLATAAGQYFNVYLLDSNGNQKMFDCRRSTAASQYIGCYIPVKKGATIRLDYSVPIEGFVFVYDEGEGNV